MKYAKYAEKRNLKKFLRARCLSYRKFCKILGISLDALNNKLNGYTPFTLADVADISIYFDLDASQICKLFLEEERQLRAEVLADLQRVAPVNIGNVRDNAPPF